MLQLPLLEMAMRTELRDGKTFVWDAIRKIWVVLTPEEHVRQLLLGYLTTREGYPARRIGVEKKVMVGTLGRRFDAVVYDDEIKPWMLIECKAPEVAVTQQTLLQLLAYHQRLQCRYWVLSNGHQTYCADAGNPQDIRWLNGLPAYDF